MAAGSWRRWQRLIGGGVLSYAVLACNAYDPERLGERGDLLSGETPRVASSAGAKPGGAGASSGAAGAAGGPSDGDVTVSVPRCGDGKVDESERCDVAIAAGSPGACPSACPPLAECVPRELSGSNCQAECVQLELLCVGGDGCCGKGCDHAKDDDCSASCGDGEVQAEEGETCEPTNADAACVTDEECDDGDPCTDDVLTGSAYTCNAACAHAPVEVANSGDGCCLEGADHNSDEDCAIVCGNGVREEGEECDGGDGCDAECHLPSMLTADQEQCMQVIGEDANDCDRCACEQCARAELDCRASGEAARDAHCAEVAQCANDHDCVSTACYCLPTDVYPYCGGPCASEINAARDSEAVGGTTITQGQNPNTALGRALLLSECKARSCSDVCP